LQYLSLANNQIPRKTNQELGLGQNVQVFW